MQNDSLLQAHWVLERTDLGQAEIATRALRLPMTVRAILLMVDGRSEVSQLLRKMSGIPEAAAVLNDLLNNQLIRRRHYSSDSMTLAASEALRQSQSVTRQALHQVERAAGHIGAAVQPAQRPVLPASTPVGKQRRSLALARLYMLDQMERMFGERSDAVRRLLRNATTREALLEAFAECREILLETSGAERTQRVAQEFLDLLPEAAVA